MTAVTAKSGPFSKRPRRYLGLLLLAGILFGLTLLPAFTSGNLSAQSSKQPGKINAIRLAQDHYFLGPVLLTVCDTALHLDCTKHMGFEVVARAPDWTVTVFRRDEKVIKSLSLKQFDNVGMMPQLLQTSRARYVPCNGRPHSFKFFGFDAQRIVNVYQTFEYIPLQGVASPTVERIIYSAYRLPTGGGLPIRYIGTVGFRDYISGKDQRGQKETNLTTSSIKRITVPSNFFMAPKDYRTVELMQHVVLSARTREQTVDFQNVFDIASPDKERETKGQSTAKPAK